MLFVKNRISFKITSLGRVVCFLIPFLFSGCSPNHKYIYQELKPLSEVSCENVRCKLVLKGTHVRKMRDNDGKKVSVVGSPYYLWIHFYANEEIPSILKLVSVEFISDGKEPVNLIDQFGGSDLKFLFEEQDSGESISSKLYRGVFLNYPTDKVHITAMVFDSKGGARKMSWVITLVPDRREEERNDSLDFWLSV